jgi:hypothetical protein
LVRSVKGTVTGCTVMARADGSPDCALNGRITVAV